VAYFTLDPLGVILDTNLAGAILLGIKGSQRARFRFAAFVSADTLGTFNRFFDEMLNAKRKTACECTLSANEQRPEIRVAILAVLDESGLECRMVVMDSCAASVLIAPICPIIK
jgi:hypothetical protein